MTQQWIATQQRDAIVASAPPPLTAGYQGEPGNGGRYLYILGMAMDLLLEKQNQGMRAHMPGAGTTTANGYLAQDRVLVQGPGESTAAFTLRLQEAFEAWEIAGTRVSVLEQLQAYLTGTQRGVALWMPEMLIVGGNTSLSSWDALYNGQAQGAEPAHSVASPANWNWDGQQKPWRSWLVLFMSPVATGAAGSTASMGAQVGSGVSGVTAGFQVISGLSGLTAACVGNIITMSGAASGGNDAALQVVQHLSSSSCMVANAYAPGSPDANNGTISWSLAAYPFIAPALPWGSPGIAYGDANRSWGLSCTPGVVAAIRSIVATWKSASTYYPNIIIAFGGGDGSSAYDFSPSAVQGSGCPDGTWGGYGKNVNGVWVPSKSGVSVMTAFCDGTGSSVNCCAQNIG